MKPVNSVCLGSTPRSANRLIVYSPVSCSSPGFSLLLTTRVYLIPQTAQLPHKRFKIRPVKMQLYNYAETKCLCVNISRRGSSLIKSTLWLSFNCFVFLSSHNTHEEGGDSTFNAKGLSDLSITDSFTAVLI